MLETGSGEWWCFVDAIENKGGLNHQSSLEHLCLGRWMSPWWLSGDFMNGVLGNLFRLDNRVFYYQILLFIGAVSYFLFGLVYLSIDIQDPMPMLHRVGGGLFLAFTLIISYFSSYIRNRITDVMYVVVLVLFTQLTYLSILNNFTLNYALSILIVLIFFNLVFTAGRKLRALNLYSIGIVVVGLFLSTPMIDILIYVVTLVFVVSGSYILSHHRWMARKRYEVIFDMSPVGMAELDRGGVILGCNVRFCDIFNVDQEEVVGSEIQSLIDIELDVGKGELELDGEKWVEYYLSRAVVMDSKRYIASFIDITDRKRVEERRRLIESLLEHDVKNKIMVLDGYFDLIRKEGLSEKQADYLKKMENAKKECKRLIDNISLLKKADTEKKHKISLNSVIDASIRSVKKEVKDELDIEIKGSSGLVVSGGSVLKNVITNLLRNAFQHGEAEKVCIRMTEKKNEVEVEVMDDGTGIEGDPRDVFKQGYTTDRESGLGLGLYLAREIVESYGGSIELTDSIYGGAGFKITLKKSSDT